MPVSKVSWLALSLYSRVWQAPVPPAYLVCKKEEQIEQKGEGRDRPLEGEDDLGSSAGSLQRAAAVSPQHVLAVSPRKLDAGVSACLARRSVQQGHAGEQFLLQPLSGFAAALQACGIRLRIIGESGICR
jgi:hypothetical protein